MKGLGRQYWRLRDERHKAAILACRLADAFNSSATPELLDKAQHAIRAGLLDIENRLRSWRNRNQRRPRKIKALRIRAGGGSSLIGDHIALCGAHEESLEEFRQLLRQCGDALAWTLLSFDPRRIFPLYGTRTHHLNTGVGIAAATHVIIEAHKTGKFLVLDNDLTRCIGIGDLTIFRADARRQELPYSLELKARLQGVEFIAGAEVSVDFGGTVFENSSQAQLHADFVQVLGLKIGAEEGSSPQSTPQLVEMYNRAHLLVEVLGGQRENLSANTEHWRSLTNVLNRAMQSDAAYDIPEPGIAIMAVRTLKGDHSPRAMTSVMRRLQSEGFPAGLPSLTL
ncbi:MAG: hypothetical protein H7Z74_18260, partial [Anaerolineae bacterium]|nr:hypothetical protein [Gemmatimonadaceae bacterium]